MSSRSQQNTASSIDKKKEELLRRIEAKKSGVFSASSTNASSSAASVSNANNSTNPNVNPILFNNDGNFFARFQAMQQQQTSSPQTPEPSKPVPSSEDNSKKRKWLCLWNLLKHQHHQQKRQTNQKRSYHVLTCLKHLRKKLVITHFWWDI